MFPRFHATKRYELIEVNIPANFTATKMTIPDQPQLRSGSDGKNDVIIQGIETFDSLGISLSPSNIAVATAANVLQTFLTLYNDGDLSISNVPLNQIKRTAAEGAAVPYTWELQRLKNLEIQWEKSFVSSAVAWGAGTPPVFTTFSFLFGIHYMKLPLGTIDQINKAEIANFCAIKVPTQ
jgi:hypothetical protein